MVLHKGWAREDTLGNDQHARYLHSTTPRNVNHLLSTIILPKVNGDTLENPLTTAVNEEQFQSLVAKDLESEAARLLAHLEHHAKAQERKAVGARLALKRNLAERSSMRKAACHLRFLASAPYDEHSDAISLPVACGSVAVSSKMRLINVWPTV